MIVARAAMTIYAAAAIILYGAVVAILYGGPAAILLQGRRAFREREKWRARRCTMWGDRHAVAVAGTLLRGFPPIFWERGFSAFSRFCIQKPLHAKGAVRCIRLSTAARGRALAT
jgi:hypothetical protein